MSPPGILFATTAHEPATEAALETALVAARELHEPLDCVFVENEELFQAAALPFTRELGRISARRIPFEPHDLVRSLDAAAIALERSARRRAEAARVTVHFTRLRGRLLPVALERSEVRLAVIAAPRFAGDGERALALTGPQIRSLVAHRSEPAGYVIVSRRTLVASEAEHAARLRARGGTIIVVAGE